MTLFNLGVAFVAARVTIHLRDIAQLIPFVTRMFFYLAESSSRSRTCWSDQPKALLGVLEANPIYVFITLVRVALLGEQSVFEVPHKPGHYFPYDAHAHLALRHRLGGRDAGRRLRLLLAGGGRVRT